MSFRTRLIHSVTIFNVEAGSTSRYGDTLEAFDEGTSAPALVQQSSFGGQAREDLTGGDIRRTEYTVFLLPSATVNGLSIIVWGDKRLKVFGEPALIYDGRTAHHLEAAAEEVLGG